MKKRILSLITLIFVFALTIVPFIAIESAAAETTTKYTFSSYAQGTQYAKNEVHVLDENITVVTNDCHFTTQLRIYSSSTNNGYAIIKSTSNRVITSLGVNAGNKADTLLVYGSNDDGATWTAIGTGISVTSTSYKDYTLNIGDDGYKWLKLDVKGSNQVRLQSITVTSKETTAACTHDNTTDTTIPATCTQDGSVTTVCDDCGETVSVTSLPATGHNYVDGVCDNCSVALPVASFATPDGTSVDNIIANNNGEITLPAAPTLPGVSYVKDYVFAGWAKSELADTTTTPVLYAAGSTAELEGNTTFYAVYSYVEAGGSSDYELTDAANIVSGSTVVITVTKSDGKTYALSNNNGTSNPPSPIAVTVTNGKLNGTPENTIKWIIDVDASGNMTFYTSDAKDYWLYCTSTNNGVRVGNTNTAKTFVVDEASGYLKHVGTGRYLGVYNVQDWRCYTSSTTNIANQTLGLYTLATEATYYTTTLEATSCQEHEFDAGEITIDPKCEIEGVITYSCLNCEYSYTETIEALVHEYQDYSAYGEASCTKNATEIAYCAHGCGTTDVREVPDSKLDHDYGEDGICDCGATNVDLSGRYYIATIRSNGNNYFYMTSDLGTASTKRYQAVDSGLTVLPSSITSATDGFVFVLEKNNDGTYSIYAEGVDDVNWIGWTSGNSATLVSAEDALRLTLDANDDGTYSFHFTGDDERYLALNGTSPNNYFAFYKSGQKQNLSLIPVTEGDADCEHNYQAEITNPTCLEQGYTTYTCTLCQDTYVDNFTDTIDHNYVNGKCDMCGDIDLNSFDLSGTYYIAAIRGSGNYWYMTANLGTASNNRYQAIDSGLTDLPESIQNASRLCVFTVVKNDDGTYSIYTEGVKGNNWLGWTSGNSGTLVSEADKLNLTLTVNDDGTYSFTFVAEDETRYLSLNGTKGNDYFAFYTGTQKHNLSLIPVESMEKITEFTGASLNIGSDLSIRYHVLLAEGDNIDGYYVNFIMNGKTVTVTEYVYDSQNGKYIFTFCGIAPQCMGDSIYAELVKDENTVDVIESYSVKQYVISTLEIYPDTNDNKELRQLVADLLYYGAAAQIYREYNLDAIVTDGIDLPEASTAVPEETTRRIVGESDGAKFKSVGVRFDYINQIFVKIYTEDIENVKVMIGETELKLAAIGNNTYVAYSYGISALEFGVSVDFDLYYNDDKVQTLTYAINDYVYGKYQDESIGELSLALYHYGISAVEYNTKKTGGNE